MLIRFRVEEEVYSLNKVRLFYPVTMVETDLEYVGFLDLLVERKIGVSTRMKIWSNFLSRESNFCKELFILYKLQKSKKAEFIIGSDVIGGGLNLREFLASVSSYFPNSMFSMRYRYRLIIKALVNSLCSIRRIRPLRSSVVIGYVEVTEQIYSKEFNTSSLVVLPFFLNVNRQLSFIGSLKKRGVNYQFVGMPYRVIDLWRILVATNDIQLFNTEISVRIRLAKQLIKKGLSEFVFTTDEWDPFSPVFHNYLKNKGVKSINTAHGVGFYSPYIEYYEFTVLTDKQRRYYQYLNPSLRIKLASGNHHVRNVSGNGNKVLYVWQNFHKKLFAYEHEWQLSLIKHLSEIYRNRLIVKVHPNSNGPMIPGNIRMTKLWSDCQGIEKVYTIYSTVANEIDDAEVYIVISDYMDGRHWLGEGFEIYKFRDA